jgi:cytochrome P450
MMLCVVHTSTTVGSFSTMAMTMTMTIATDEGTRTSHFLLIAITIAIAIAITLGYAIRHLFFPAVPKNAPPAADVGMFETINAISGPEAPFFLLKLARSVLQKDANAKIFRVPIPLPGGVYVVAGADLQRQVMKDKRADKPTAIYGKFDTPGYPATIFTRQTQDPMWKVTRKCAAPAFSKTEVNRMNAVCSKHVELWMEERLEGIFIAEDKGFDPSKEMTRLTFSTVFEAGFEYVPTHDEFDRYTHNLNTYIKEFGFRQVANPLRRPFGWFLTDIDKP